MLVIGASWETPEHNGAINARVMGRRREHRPRGAMSVLRGLDAPNSRGPSRLIRSLRLSGMAMPGCHARRVRRIGASSQLHPLVKTMGR